MQSITVDGLVDHHLGLLNYRISKRLKAHCIFINADIAEPLDNFFKNVLYNYKTTDIPSRKHLVVMLQTYGGSMEVVERLVNTMRERYQRVSFIIPDYAYSAGTVLALSGNDFYELLFRSRAD